MGVALQAATPTPRFFCLQSGRQDRGEPRSRHGTDLFVTALGSAWRGHRERPSRAHPLFKTRGRPPRYGYNRRLEERALASTEPRHTVAVVGGTGPQGRGLSLRLAAAGWPVLVGSRDDRTACAAVELITTALLDLPGARVPEGMVNSEAVSQASIIVLSVPWSAHNAVLEELRPHMAGKVLIDVVVALGKPIDVIWHPPAGSSALEAARIVGETCAVAAAFQNIAARKLERLGEPLDCDVLVCADDPRAKEAALSVAEAIGARAFDAGPLVNAAAVEGMTAILIGINRRYGSKQAGIFITGVGSVL